MYVHIVNMFKVIMYFWATLLLVSVAGNASAQEVEVYRMVPSSVIKASASSTFRSTSPSAAVNGEGMTGEGHVSNNGGEAMWFSESSKRPVRYSKGTPSGAVWFVTEFEKPLAVDEIRIWNHNQNDHTRRGLNKVHIDYSIDGKHWTSIRNGDGDWHFIPESVGKNGEKADYILDIPGKEFRYLCITASSKSGNHYDMSDPLVVMWKNRARVTP